MVRQYLVELFELKYFVNVCDVLISFYGVVFYVFLFFVKRFVSEDGLSFQFWIDFICDFSIEVEFEVDFSGSFGKLYMCYCIVFVVFLLFVVVFVLCKQFCVYDIMGVFIIFIESLDFCFRQFILLMFVLFIMLIVVMVNLNLVGSVSFWYWNKSIFLLVDFYFNDYLIGIQDLMFLFLIFMIGIICIGVCIVFNYIIFVFMYLLSSFFNLLVFCFVWVCNDECKK